MVSDSLAPPPPTTTAIPRRVMRARREAAEALGLPFESQIPGWSVAPAPDYGSAVRLEDGDFGATSPR
jgi:hypothetical protein